MLFLNEKDMRSASSYDKLMDTIEEAFQVYTEKKFMMPDRLAVEYQGNTMIYMPCFVQGFIGTKILAEWPGNPAKGLPYLDGLMLLNDEIDGQVKAILNGNTLTGLRTGAVGGVAMRHLAKADVHTAGVIGCGVQGLHQLCYACYSRDIKTIYLYDAIKKDLTAFIARLQELIAPRTVECVVCQDAESLLAASEVVYTTTQATEPVLPNDPKKLEGKLFIAIGSWRPTMREIPEAIWEVVDEVYTELPYACEESGDLSQPLASGSLTKDRIKLMGDFLSEKKNGQEKQLGETRFYKSVGMGIFDTMVAKRIFDAAQNEGLGQNIEW